MKFFKIIISTAFCVNLVAGAAHAVEISKTAPAQQSGSQNFGIGIGLIGVPALSLYMRTSPSHFAQGGVTFSGRDFAATIDYCFAYPGVFQDIPALIPYWGGGLVMLHDGANHYYNYDDDGHEGETFTGARIPLGVNFVIPRTPVQLGAEVSPTLLLAPASYSYVQGDVHVRILL